MCTNCPATSPAFAGLVWYTNQTMRFDPDKITYFAQTDARGQAVKFGIKAKDRQRHMYVVGKTGMGKSTLLDNMAAQDIQNGEGMAFIDPHGSAAETLLDYIPEHRIDDVVYFAPFDMEHPVAFNVMEDVGADKRHLVVSGLMSTFKKIWVDAWSARMEYILTNALLALIEYPDTTLLSVNRLFADKAYREKVVDYIQDPAVKSFWTEEFANYTDRFAAEALPAIQNKIGQFTGNPLIRNIIGQPKSSFNIRELMDNRKILIMNLSKGLVGETNANLLGSMLTTRIYLAAMSRADLPLETMKQMPNFYFYVDEFQSFANSTFSNILSEARKYHLNLIIAHQYIQQMEEEVKDAVFGNVGTTVTFRVGPFDAEVLETIFTPKFLAADLVNLGFAQIYLTLMIDGIGSPPFSAVTLPPIQPPEVSYKRMAIAASRKNYANERAAVEQLVARLHTPSEPTSPRNKTKSANRSNERPKANTPAPRHNNDSSKNDATTAPRRPDSSTLKDVLSYVREETDRPPAKQIHSDRAPRERAVPTNNEKAERPSSETKEPAATDATSPPRPTAKPEQPPSPKKTAKTNTDPDSQLNELRSVLAKLAAHEKKKASADQQKQVPKNERRNSRTGSEKRGPHTPTPTSGDLKSTLQDVLKQHAQANDKDATNRRETTGQRETIGDTPAPQHTAVPTPSKQSAQPPMETASDQPAAKATDDPLDPKELKRILKKGGSSYPPYA